jgi:hypothetical protein
MSGTQKSSLTIPMGLGRRSTTLAASPKTKLAARLYQKVWTQVESGASSRRDDRAVSTVVNDPRWEVYFNSVFASTVGTIPAQVSIKDMANYVDSEIDFAVESGLGQQLRAAFSMIPVRLGQRVVEIERSENVRLRTESGDTVLARCCLLTMSPPVMRKIKFSPPLPKEHQNSLETIRMGLLETVAMEFYEDLFEGPDNVFLYIGGSRGPYLSYLIKPAGRRSPLVIWRARSFEQLPETLNVLLQWHSRPWLDFINSSPSRSCVEPCTQTGRAMGMSWARCLTSQLAIHVFAQT